MSANREVRADLSFAVEQLDTRGTAVDCGCGAGSDIAYLAGLGFTVHAFDFDADAVDRCRARFINRQDVLVSEATFTSFDYPSSVLLVADASLFFCPRIECDEAWRKIASSLLPGGIFSGSFLGERDSQATGQNYWNQALPLSESEVRNLFLDFQILRWNEHEADGFDPQGEACHWHIYSVVARKNSG